MRLFQLEYEKILKNCEYYSSGLIHDIYKWGKFIVKIPKDAFLEFHTPHHFLIEKNSLRLLSIAGYPSPKIYKILRESNRFGQKAILIQQYVRGIQKVKSTLSKKEQYNLFKFIECIHRINLEGYGPVDIHGKGTFMSWTKYLKYLIKLFHDSYRDFSEIIAFLNSLDIKKLQYNETPKFLLADINPGNVFFNKHGKLKWIIDIDHPEAGDPLFDLAFVKWYNPTLYKTFAIKASDKKILTYEILVGLKIILFQKQFNLPTKKDLKRVVQKIANVQSL
jgi:aminoglycoside phosphotransferase (APT) family kinase protein